MRDDNWQRTGLHSRGTEGHSPAPPEPAPVVTGSRVPAFWHGPSAWVNSPGGAAPDMLAAFRQYGYRLLIVRLPAYFDMGCIGRFAVWRDRVRAHGFQVAGWAWGDGSSPEAQGVEWTSRALGFGLDGFCFNGEKAEEGRARSAVFVKAAREIAGPDFPLAWSPEPRLDLAHDVFREHGVAYMPQAYPLEQGYDVTACVKIAVDEFGYQPADVIPLCRATSPHDENERFPASTFAVQCHEAHVPGRCLYPADANMGVPDYWREFAA